jgi:uncharacterized membrane protein
MKKSIFTTNLLNLIVLSFIAVKNGMDFLLLLAIIINLVANGLNVACLMKEARKSHGSGR